MHFFFLFMLKRTSYFNPLSVHPSILIDTICLGRVCLEDVQSMLHFSTGSCSLAKKKIRSWGDSFQEFRKYNTCPKSKRFIYIYIYDIYIILQAMLRYKSKFNVKDRLIILLIVIKIQGHNRFVFFSSSFIMIRLRF